MTSAVTESTTPLIAIWAPLVIVHKLPLASVIPAVEPARTQSFAEGGAFDPTV